MLCITSSMYSLGSGIPAVTWKKMFFYSVTSSNTRTLRSPNLQRQIWIDFPQLFASGLSRCYQCVLECSVTAGDVITIPAVCCHSLKEGATLFVCRRKFVCDCVDVLMLRAHDGEMQHHANLFLKKKEEKEKKEISQSMSFSFFFR